MGQFLFFDIELTSITNYWLYTNTFIGIEFSFQHGIRKNFLVQVTVQ